MIHDTPSQRLIVVLGMHRSGTSALARALKVFGADLGADLLPPVPGNNERGFWEDRQIVAINDAVLGRLGLAWDAIAPVDAAALAGDRMADLRLRAVAHLRQRLDDTPVFAVKDPRMCRLLPFWRDVFAHIGVRVDLVMSLRNPVSVAQSLLRRDGIPAAKAYVLWLQHVTSMVLDAPAGAGRERTQRCVVVEYERLLATPEPQLERLAHALELPFDAQSEASREYVEAFLDAGLDHGGYLERDLEAIPGSPGEVLAIYRELRQAATGGHGIPDASESACREWRSRARALAPLLEHCWEQEQRASQSADRFARLEKELHATRELLADRQARVVALSKLQKALDEELPEPLGRHLRAIAMEAAERTEGRLRAMAKEVVDGAEAQAARSRLAALAERLEAAGVALEAQVDANVRAEASLKEAIQQLEQHRLAWQQGLSERSEEIARLSHLLLQAQDHGHRLESELMRSRARETALQQDRDAAAVRAGAAEQRLAGLLASWSWRLSAPLRWPGSALQWLRPSRWRRLADRRAVAGSGLFDGDWYLARYPDVLAARSDPLDHYLAQGAAEGRDPGPGFSTQRYLADNPDVASAGMNPLLHYVRHGRAEGREPTGAVG